MIKVGYILSFITKSVAFEWIVQELDKSRFELTFILLNPEDSSLEQFLRSENVPVFRVPYHGKKDLPSALLKTRRILKQQKIEIVHAHLFDASLIGLMAARVAGIKRRIHTRHNATIHLRYHPHAVKYDRLINRLSTDIVAISENVRKIVTEQEGADPRKITLIHHGFRLEAFEQVPEERVARLREKHLGGVQAKQVIGVISRYIHWKGIQHIVPAFRELLKTHPETHLVLCGASGPYENEIRELLSELPAGSYTEIAFEEDVFALYGLFDYFVHVPIDEESEAFGQIYIETMAARVPAVVTLSGIAPDYIVHRENAWVVPFEDPAAIREGLHALITDRALRDNIVENASASVHRLFGLDRMIRSLENLYER